MMNSQGWVLLPEAAFEAASRMVLTVSPEIGSGLNTRMDLRLLIPSSSVSSRVMSHRREPARITYCLAPASKLKTSRGIWDSFRLERSRGKLSLAEEFLLHLL